SWPRSTARWRRAARSLFRPTIRGTGNTSARSWPFSLIFRSARANGRTDPKAGPGGKSSLCEKACRCFAVRAPPKPGSARQRRYGWQERYRRRFLTRISACRNWMTWRGAAISKVAASLQLLKKLRRHLARAFTLGVLAAAKEVASPAAAQLHRRAAFRTGLA